MELPTVPSRQAFHPYRPGNPACPRWIGCNVLDGLVWDRATKEMIITADQNHPRHYEEESKRQIVQSYENGKPSSRIREEYGIPRSTLQRWVQGIRNSGSTRG